MTAPTLATPRLVLRAVEAGDADVLHALFTEPGVYRFLFDGCAPSREETLQHVETARQQPAWVMCEGGTVVGLVSLRPLDSNIQLTIAVTERRWGSGLSFEAAEAAMRYGFDVLQLDRIVAFVDLPNERSHRLMTRLGFGPCGESDGPKYRMRGYESLRG